MGKFRIIPKPVSGETRAYMGQTENWQKNLSDYNEFGRNQVGSNPPEFFEGGISYGASAPAASPPAVASVKYMDILGNRKNNTQTSKPKTRPNEANIDTKLAQNRPQIGPWSMLGRCLGRLDAS